MNIELAISVLDKEKVSWDELDECCKNNVIAKPNAINLYFSLVKSKAAFTPRINNNKYANNKKVTPIKPNSSPIAAKIKSV